MIYRKYLKPILDTIFALFLCLILAPFLIIISILIKIESRGSILFLQSRLGKKGKEFKIYKFRTMVENAENVGTGLFTDGNDPRITKIGKILRKYSLDELPQLYNIVKGDMSFIGPRPPVPYHPYKLEDYPIELKKRFLVKPGLTGLAQINGRTNLTWPERIKFDLEYVSNYNLFFDIKILFLTIVKMFKKQNIYPQDINIGRSHINDDKGE